MKTIITITLIIICNYSIGFGQESEKDRSSLLLGGHIGLNHTTVEGLLVDNHVSFNGRTRGKIYNRTGINISFLLKYDVRKYIFLKTGIGYFQKGAYVESTLIQNFNAQVNYLNIPLIVGVQIPLNNQTSLAAESGISLNSQVGCKGEGCLDLEDTFTPGRDPGPQLFTTKSPMDFLIGIVAEHKLPNSNRLFISCRYFKDLSYFYGSDKDLRFSGVEKPDADFSATHKGFSLIAGMLFPIW